MNTHRILNIATAIVALATCYILIFEDTKDNKVFWGVLALFFILLAARRMKGTPKNSDEKR